MKKLLLILIVLCPMTVSAYNLETRYTWSYGALADTMKSMRNNCEVTTKDEFLIIGNWMRTKKAIFSLNELISQCKVAKFSNINRAYKDKKGVAKKCQMPNTSCNDTSCGEKEFTNNSGCNIFISTLIKHNNARVNIRKHGKAGTYVTKVKLNSGGHAYKIVDVILARSYQPDKKINTDVDNTKIYEITSNGIVDTGWRTWTNDMFMDISAGGTYGDVRGAFVNSYIRPDKDLTNEINAMYDKRRGRPGASVPNARDSYDGGAFDVKKVYAKKFQIHPQTETEAQSNGVMYDGKIAHLDWLGHFLYGMNRQEATLPNAVGDMVANAIQNEPKNLVNAWDLGSEQVKKWQQKRIKTFANIQTGTEEEAYKLAAKEMRKIYPNAQGISCTGNCNPNPGTTDVVICTAKPNLRLEFEFDDICND